MVTEATWRRWRPEDFLPYLEVILGAFGPDRLIFGSDWPVCLVSGAYAEVAGIVREFVAQLGPDEQKAIWGGAARRIYGLE